ncbi:MAG: glycosyltransferase family 2 protein [Candidatus Nanoarchaeia archaeon]|jgi:glycosyltransferase involved in cell wall biosynthesis
MTVLLSIVVPCYNEGKNIPFLVKRFLEAKKDNTSSQLVMVNNGSTDNSLRLMRQFAAKYSSINIVNIKYNKGYGHGIWSGISKASGKFIAWTHADLQTDIKDAFVAYDLIKHKIDNKTCFVKGKRKKRAFFDSFFSYAMSIFESIVFGRIVYDINAQPNLFHREFLKQVHNPPLDFSFDLFIYLTALYSKQKIIRFPVDFPERIHGQSHWNTGIRDKYKFIKRTISFTWELKRRMRKNDNSRT